MFDRVYVNITWHCSFNNCPYCWHRTVGGKLHIGPTKVDIDADRKPEEWIEALNKLDPAVFDFVGGEPMTYDGLVKILVGLSPKHKFAITTNAYGKQLLEFLGEAKNNAKLREQCVVVTFSWHPTGKLTLQEFKNKIVLARDAGLLVAVNIVNHESIRAEIPEALREFAKMGLRRELVSVSPYEDPFELVEKSGIILACDAGITHYVINNEGTVHKCLTAFRSQWRDDFVLGNIFDGSFKKIKERGRCDLSCDKYFRVSKRNTMVRDLKIEEVKDEDTLRE